MNRTVLNRFIKMIVRNIHNKYTNYFIWKNKRKQVKNWGMVYLLSTSLFLELYNKITRFFQWKKSGFITVKYKNGFNMSYPYDKANELHHFMNIYDNYIGNFHRLCNFKIEFSDEDLILDIGAHVGGFGLAHKFKHPNSNVWFFEADENNFQMLKKNWYKNNFGNIQGQLFCQAVYGSRGNFDFSIGRTSTIGSINEVEFYGATKKAELVSVHATTIDDILKNVESCKLVKMDIEGSEHSTIRGISNSTLDKISYMIVEAHPVKDETISSLESYLKSKGFQVKTKAYDNECVDFYCFK
jgi:FkbM family methyltransferase